jgi:hypothetical protein
VAFGFEEGLACGKGKAKCAPESIRDWYKRLKTLRSVFKRLCFNHTIFIAVQMDIVVQFLSLNFIQGNGCVQYRVWYRSGTALVIKPIHLFLKIKKNAGVAGFMHSPKNHNNYTIVQDIALLSSPFQP